MYSILEFCQMLPFMLPYPPHVDGRQLILQDRRLRREEFRNSAKKHSGKDPGLCHRPCPHYRNSRCLPGPLLQWALSPVQPYEGWRPPGKRKRQQNRVPRKGVLFHLVPCCSLSPESARLGGGAGFPGMRELEGAEPQGGKPLAPKRCPSSDKEGDM